jgi:4-diphosphocytidyl-2-C-methyl-D-erythritol kinase
LTLRQKAPAKINLNLAVHGRRGDGYHELTSLVAFAGTGDALSLEAGAASGLSISGPFAEGLEADGGNLVLRAAQNLAGLVPTLRMGRFHLVKRLPLASGIGGGSADAAAALRLLAALNGLEAGHPALEEAARLTGADVPVCLRSRACVMSGAGEILGPGLSLPPLFAVLVNPGVAVATAAVFAGLGLEPGQAARPRGEGTPEESWSEGWRDGLGFMRRLAEGQGNDLQEPALGLAPVMGEALDALAGLEGCRLARMSGSGATCFALFDDCRASARAAAALRAKRPGWWVKATALQ